MAFKRGVDGYVQIAGTTVAQVKSWSMTVNVADLDTSVVGQYWKTSVSEVASWSGDLEIYLDETLAEQSVLFNWFTGATPGGAAATVNLVVLGPSNTPTEYFSGTVVFKSFAPSVALGKVTSAKVAFVGSGQLTLTWS